MDGNGFISSKIKKYVIFGSVGCLPLIVFLGLPLVVTLFLVLGLFDSTSNAGNAISNGGSGTCSYNVNGQSISNLKVRLLNCEGNTAVAGEELIDFETYIIGVVYAENGSAPYEALKTQAVATRTYSLLRAKNMNNNFGISLKQEDDYWVLSLRSCTLDQVFCNPDKGCWSNRAGGQTGDKSTWANSTVHSGYDKSKAWSIGPVASDSDIRKAVEETKGQLYADTNNKLVNTSYVSSTQKQWNSLASKGKDYFSILVNSYGKGKIVNSTCSSGDSESIDASGYVAWMIAFSKDESHGYSQKNRTMNPDVDCSSFVYYGLLNGGGFTKEQLGSYPFTTDTMGSILERIGFKAYSFKSVSDLKEGDILWRNGHTEVYIGNGQNVGAHNNVPSRYAPNRSPKPGDQGDEVNVSSTGTNWTRYYRKSN